MSDSKFASDEVIAGKWKGHLAMMFANMMWGLMAPVSKSVMLTGCVTPLSLSSIRITGGAVLFWLLSFILPQSVVKKEKIEKRDLLKIFFASLLIISVNQALFIIGIGYTNPIDASVMSTLTPIFTMIFAALFIHERITPLKTLGVILGTSGALMLILYGAQPDTTAVNPVLGSSLCLIAQVCAALYYVLFKDIIKKYSPYTLMKWLFLFSVITYIPFTVPELMKLDISIFTPVTVADIAFIIIFPTFISYLLIPFSQKLLKPTVVSMYNYLQPVTSALLATVLGLAAFGAVKAGATALIFLGVWVVTQSRNTQSWKPVLRFLRIK